MSFEEEVRDMVAVSEITGVDISDIIQLRLALAVEGLMWK